MASQDLQVQLDHLVPLAPLAFLVGLVLLVGLGALDSLAHLELLANLVQVASLVVLVGLVPLVPEVLQVSNNIFSFRNNIPLVLQAIEAASLFFFHIYTFMKKREFQVFARFLFHDSQLYKTKYSHFMKVRLVALAGQEHLVSQVVLVQQVPLDFLGHQEQLDGLEILEYLDQ